jgi:HEPN domain-containing protein
MLDRDKLIAVCAEWVVKAENDLTNAAHTLKLRETCPTDTVCFHAQQCVEKYLKAILVMEGIDFPKTHDLERLMALVPAGLRPGVTSEEQARLTEYATVARYPRLGGDSAGRGASRRGRRASGPQGSSPCLATKGRAPEEGRLSAARC